MYRSAVYDEPLLNELIGNKKENIYPLSSIPKNLQKTKIADIPNLDETQVVRHFHHLSQMNYGIDSGIYPLGSCTMKYNPRLCEQIASWDKFSGIHPCQHFSTVQGNLQIMFDLEKISS